MFFTTLASGSKGNCTLIGAKSTRILVDAGISCRAILQGLHQIGEGVENLSGIFITHEHSDHIKGVYQLAKRYGIPVFASPKTWDALPFREALAGSCCRTYEYQMAVGDLEVDFFKTSHDAVEPVGMIFRNSDEAVGFVTDTGKVTNSMLHKLQGLKGIIMEANHNLKRLQEGPYPYFLKQRIASGDGHMSNAEAGKLLHYVLANSCCDRHQPFPVILAHLSEVNNTPQLAVKDVRDELTRLGNKVSYSLAVAPVATPLAKVILTASSQAL